MLTKSFMRWIKEDNPKKLSFGMRESQVTPKFLTSKHVVSSTRTWVWNLTRHIGPIACIFITCKLHKITLLKHCSTNTTNEGDPLTWFRVKPVWLASICLSLSVGYLQTWMFRSSKYRHFTDASYKDDKKKKHKLTDEENGQRAMLLEQKLHVLEGLSVVSRHGFADPYDLFHL